MSQKITAFEDPLASLGTQEQLGINPCELSFLCGLIRTYKPRKIVAAGTGEVIAAVTRRCLKLLHMESQMYCVNESSDATQNADAPALAEGKAESGSYHVLSGRPFSARMDEIGGEIDFLILNAAGRSPKELLDFLAAFPYLTPDAVVAVRDSTVQNNKSAHKIGSSFLVLNVTADQLGNHSELYPDTIDRVRYAFSVREEGTAGETGTADSDIITGFRLNSGTKKYLKDLFFALYTPWPFPVAKEHLYACNRLIEKNYNRDYLYTYERAIVEEYSKHKSCSDRLILAAAQKMVQVLPIYEDMFVELVQSLFQTFQYVHVLLYGKGVRGQLFLHFAEAIGLHISGFVISDGRLAPNSFKGLPVYEFSKIPYACSETLIIQSTRTTEVELTLRKSRYHWLKLPENYWRHMVLYAQLKGRYI